MPEIGDPTANLIQRTNLTQQVYEYLKEQIVNRELKGGETLIERKLAEELNVSKTPVREAIARLEREGLVVGSPGRSMRVREVTRQEVQDMLEVRMILEGFAAEMAALRTSEGLKKRLEVIVSEGDQACKKGDLQAYKRSDTAFHRTILEAAGNQELVQIMESLENKVRIVMSTSVKLPGRAKQSQSEHRQILEAICQGDVTRAYRLGRDHIAEINTLLQDIIGTS